MNEFNLSAIPTLQIGKTYALDPMDWNAVTTKRSTLTRYSKLHPGFEYETSSHETYGRPGMFTLVVKVINAGESVINEQH